MNWQQYVDQCVIAGGDTVWKVSNVPSEFLWRICPVGKSVGLTEVVLRNYTIVVPHNLVKENKS